MELRKRARRAYRGTRRTGLDAADRQSDARSNGRPSPEAGFRARSARRFGPETPLGKRRTTVEEAAPAREIPLEAMIEREPITVILSQRGWIRAMKGHIEPAAAAELKFKEGDAPFLHFSAQTTDKILLAAENGRFYTLAADKLPGGRGFGEPVRGDDRPRRRYRHRRADAGKPRRKIAGRRHRRARLRGADRGYHRRDAQGQDRGDAAPGRQAQARPADRSGRRLCRG